MTHSILETKVKLLRCHFRTFLGLQLTVFRKIMNRLFEEPTRVIVTFLLLKF